MRKPNWRWHFTVRVRRKRLPYAAGPIEIREFDPGPEGSATYYFNIEDAQYLVGQLQRAIERASTAGRSTSP